MQTCCNSNAITIFLLYLLGYSRGFAFVEFLDMETAKKWINDCKVWKKHAYFEISRTNVASVGSVFNDTRKVKVLSLTLSFRVVREPLPFAYHNLKYQFLSAIFYHTI